MELSLSDGIFCSIDDAYRTRFLGIFGEGSKYNYRMVQCFDGHIEREVNFCPVGKFPPSSVARAVEQTFLALQDKLISALQAETSEPDKAKQLWWELKDALRGIH